MYVRNVDMTYDPSLDLRSQEQKEKPIYSYPKRGVKVAFNSFKNHARIREERLKDYKPPSEEEFEYAKQVFEEMLDPWHFEIPSDFLERTHFDRVLMDIDWTKSPGYPFILKGYTTKKQVKDFYGDDELWRMVQERLHNLEYTDSKTGEYEISSYVDPVRVFQKHEIMKSDKIGLRERIISSVSLIDELIDRLLLSEATRTCMDTFESHPIKVGFSHVNGNYDRCGKFLNDPNDKFASFDRSMFDWTVTEEWIDATTECYIRRASGDGSPDGEFNFVRWRQILRNRDYSFYKGDWYLENGMLLRQSRRGIIRSGRLDTFLRNSMVLILKKIISDKRQGIRTRRRDIVCAGDDEVSSMSGRDIDKILQMHTEWGFKTTLEAPVGPLNGQIFCSYMFKNDHPEAKGIYVPVAQNVEKNLLSLCSIEEGSKEEDIVGSISALCTLYAFHPLFDDIYRLLVARTKGVYSSMFKSKEWHRRKVTIFESAASAANFIFEEN
jgi:hypothetical protein